MNILFSGANEVDGLHGLKRIRWAETMFGELLVQRHDELFGTVFIDGELLVPPFRVVEFVQRALVGVVQIGFALVTLLVAVLRLVRDDHLLDVHAPLVLAAADRRLGAGHRVEKEQ